MTETQRHTLRSNGKLLITGEYVVLDGAKALAIPTKYGQSLVVKPNNSQSIIWESYDHNKVLWFKEELSLDLESTKTSNSVSERLIQILVTAKRLNPNFLSTIQGFTIQTYLEFQRDWGLGSSSTLLNNIAEWAKIDPHKLSEFTFGGSGYDIACASHNMPILYQLDTDKNPIVHPVTFQPEYLSHLSFVHLNKKQNSREGIFTYRSKGKVHSHILDEISLITEAIIKSKTLSEFNELISTHEAIISSLIQQVPIKAELFSDFNGEIKSLGAWGGDFVLVSSEEHPRPYFESKGFHTIIPYKDMVY